MTPAPDADGWIEWSGGECPVPGKKVHYRMVDGHEDYGILGSRDGHLAENLRWQHLGHSSDIVAYRVRP